MFTFTKCILENTYKFSAEFSSLNVSGLLNAFKIGPKYPWCDTDRFWFLVREIILALPVSPKNRIIQDVKDRFL